MKFKPDELTVYSKGENIYDASTDEIIFKEKNKLQANYSNASLFLPYGQI
jgi:hypothetical protein